MPLLPELGRNVSAVATKIALLRSWQMPAVLRGCQARIAQRSRSEEGFHFAFGGGLAQEFLLLGKDTVAVEPMGVGFFPC
jgi:hypothetical protein